MSESIQTVSEEILKLLNITNKAITVDKFYHFLDEPHYLINASLNQLIKNGLVKGEFKNGKNYISIVLHSQISALC